MPDPIRASDRERDAATARLRTAHIEGRLSTEELEDRVARAQTAATRADLDALEADLPGPRPDLELTDGVPWWPGRRVFAERKLLDASPGECRTNALAFMAPSLERFGFHLTKETPEALIFAQRPRGQVGADRVTVRFLPVPDGRTLVLAHGTAPLKIRRAFAKLTD